MCFRAGERTLVTGVFARSEAARSGKTTGRDGEGRTSREAAECGGCEEAGSEEVDCGSGEIEQKGSAVGEDGGDGQEAREREQEVRRFATESQRAQRKNAKGEEIGRFDGGDGQEAEKRRKKIVSDGVLKLECTD